MKEEEGLKSSASFFVSVAVTVAAVSAQWNNGGFGGGSGVAPQVSNEIFQP